ncbi:MAG: dihydroneopterin aldolase [Bacteroidales bacterium]|nr:dihydroneopterin aldolase [Bacteroidales bacterium]
METYIEINNLRLHAYHGVLNLERSVGNDYRVDCTLAVNQKRAAESDLVADTVDYVDVVNVIQREMEQPSDLLEHVASRIMEHLHDRWPNVAHIDLRIEKKCPPIVGADIEGCAIRMKD